MGSSHERVFDVDVPGSGGGGSGSGSGSGNGSKEDCRVNVAERPDFTGESARMGRSERSLSVDGDYDDDYDDNDVGYTEEEIRALFSATWSDVLRACCVHTPAEWLRILGCTVLLAALLYFFLLGLELLCKSAKILGGCSAASLLDGGESVNPVASLMIGILATALLQSSSTTTSVVVSLAGSGTLSVQQGIYIIMGANIGTTITNTVVALGMMGQNKTELERAFAGASVHDIFNYLSVVVLLPLEVATGYLYRMTLAMIPEARAEGGGGGGRSWAGPVKRIISPLADLIIDVNTDIIEDVARGGSCQDHMYYPVRCKYGIKDYGHCRPCKAGESLGTCDPKVQGSGLIGCSSSTNNCPAFFTIGAFLEDDRVSAGVSLFLAFFLLVTCLVGLVTLLQRMLLGVSTRIIYRATNVNGYVAMVLGCGVTVLVQSSSVTTATLTPLVGMGILSVEQMFPLTLGANVGTTCTALMAAAVSDGVEGLQTALAHLFFNLSGILLWYPLPPLRRVPLDIACRLGKGARLWRGVPILYLAVAFFIFPLTVLGLSTCFEKGSLGYTVLGAFFCIVIISSVLYFLYWWRFRNGEGRCVDCVMARQRRAVAMDELADDMDQLRKDVVNLKKHCSLSETEVRRDDNSDDVEECGNGMWT